MHHRLAGIVARESDVIQGIPAWDPPTIEGSGVACGANKPMQNIFQSTR